MGYYKVDYTETRTITIVVEADNGEEAYDLFHNVLDDHLYKWQYKHEETEVSEVEEDSEEVTKRFLIFRKEDNDESSTKQ